MHQQLDDYLSKGRIKPSVSLYKAPILFSQKGRDALNAH